MRDTETPEMEVRPTSPENCFASVQKAGRAEGLSPDVVVVDTGQPIIPPLEMRSPQTPEEVDEIYRWTIRNGIIDHHGVDASVLEMPEGGTRRCAAKMVADFPDEVLALIQEKNIKGVSGHIDSDLDSITATYLTKILVDTRSVSGLPKFTQKLGEIVNLVDYGRFGETDPQRFIKSLPGYFGSLKNVLFDKMHAAIGAIWRSAEIPKEEKAGRSKAVSEQFHGELITQMFAIFNACAKAESEGFQINFEDLDTTNGLTFSDEFKELLRIGREKSLTDVEAFNQEFESAEQRRVTIRTKEGANLEVTLLIFGQTKLSPLAVTNMAYMRMPPETIVAVYAGQDRKKGGDNYDIGMKVESLDLFDLTSLEAIFNDAEREKREPILLSLRQKEKEGTLSEEETKLLKTWTTLRPGKEYLGIGDPTVCVAGGSLIAASKTSLLNAEDFRRVVTNFFSK